MNLNESIRDWIENQRDSYASLAGLEVVTMGETDDLDPPFLGIMETGSEQRETGGVLIPGVSDYELTCELHTVPASSDEEGTPVADARTMRRDLYDILGDLDAIDWINGLNDWQVFDIRLAGPTTEASDGRLISRWILQITACPT